MEFLILLAILPGLIICILIYNQDKKEREPKRELLKAFLLGVLAVILTLLVSYICKIPLMEIDRKDWISLCLYTFLGISLIEEFSKWICSYLFLKQNKNYDYLFDGIVYTTFISIGFATIENILYTVNGGIFTGIVRAITTVPAHAFFGVISGYYFSMSKLAKIRIANKKWKKYFVFSLAFPVLLHGFYDFCLLTQNIVFFFVYLIFMVLLYSVSIYRMKELKEIDEPFINEKEK